MADKLMSTLSKTAGRAQERVMQKLGKADETVDEVFNQNVKNFTKQHTAASRVFKEAKSFQQALQVITNASKSLNESILEAFGEDWSGANDFQETAQLVSKSWTQLQQHANELLVNCVSSYLNGKFPEFKNRIAKRDRKLIDYDRYRHALSSIKSKSKASDAKLAQAEEEHAQAKEIFEELNAQLNAELPDFYIDRIQMYQNMCHGLYSALHNCSESHEKCWKKLHNLASGNSEMAQVSLLDALVSDASTRVVQPTNLSSSSSFLDNSPTVGFSAAAAYSGGGSAPQGPSVTTSSNVSAYGGFQSQPLSALSKSTSSLNETDNNSSSFNSNSNINSNSNFYSNNNDNNNYSNNNINNNSNNNNSQSNSARFDNIAFGSSANSNNSSHGGNMMTINGSLSNSNINSNNNNDNIKEIATSPILQPFLDTSASTALNNSAPLPTASTFVLHQDSDEDEEVTKKLQTLAKELVGDGNNQVQSASAIKKSVGPKVLFTVRATHQYDGLEDDELSFAKGEIISVLEADDADELDDGWQVGVLQNGRKGVFPTNFTEKINQNSKAYLL